MRCALLAMIPLLWPRPDTPNVECLPDADRRMEPQRYIIDTRFSTTARASSLTGGDEAPVSEHILRALQTRGWHGGGNP